MRLRTQVKVFFPSDVAGCVNSQIGYRIKHSKHCGKPLVSLAILADEPHF